MSQENVEIVRRAYEALAQFFFDQGEALEAAGLGGARGS
jgi:hypothetical protein